MRRRRQGAAGILPAVLFSDWSAGKMPAALWSSWKVLSALRPCIGTMNPLVLVLVLVLEDKPPIEDEDEQDDEDETEVPGKFSCQPRSVLVSAPKEAAPNRRRGLEQKRQQGKPP